MGIPRFIKYEWRILSRAFSDTRKTLLPKGQAMIRGLLFIVLTLILGTAFHFHIWGPDQVLIDKLKESISFGILAVPTAGIIFFVVLLVINLLLTPFRIQRESDAENDDLKNQIHALKTPNLEIRWGDHHPYKHDGPYLDLTNCKRLWRVGVKNLSKTKTIDNVFVEIKEMIRPEGRNAVFPARLRLMDDKPGAPSDPERRGFTLHPEAEIPVEVVGLCHNPQTEDDYLFLCYADKFRPDTLKVEPVYPFSEEGLRIQDEIKIRISAGEVIFKNDPIWPLQSYDITIKVTGRDVPSICRDFEIEPDKKGELHFRPSSECYSDADS